MKFFKTLKHAVNMVTHAKLRSWLTILGIVIGVAAVIAIVSLGQALEEDMNSQFGELGGDLLTLRAGASRAEGFGPGRSNDRGGSATATDEEIVIDRIDIQVLKGISEIKVFDVQINGRADAYFVAEKGSVSIVGVDPASWYQISTIDLADGRTLGPADTNVIVIGGRIANDFFDKKLGVNQLITIEDKLFRIVGILDDESTTVYMPITQAYTVLDDKEEGIYDSVIIKVKDENLLDSTIATIEQKLILSRHVTDKTKDFSISSNKERQEQRAEMVASMTTFLTAIAAVALLVGAVGIANSMFTSVLEKTKEIGIMKAIGARNFDIMRIFILNAALIGFIGGVLGILLGMFLSGLLPSLMGASGGMLTRLGSTSTIIGLKNMILALLLSVGIGVISGLIPAYQASKLKPVDALRYE